MRDLKYNNDKAPAMLGWAAALLFLIVNSLDSGARGSNFIDVYFLSHLSNLVSWPLLMKLISANCHRTPQSINTTLVQAMAWYRQQCWPRTWGHMASLCQNTLTHEMPATHATASTAAGFFFKQLHFYEVANTSPRWTQTHDRPVTRYMHALTA